MNGIGIKNNKKSLLASSSLSKSVSGSSLFAKRLLVQKAQSFQLKNNNSGNEDTHERLQLVANQLAQKRTSLTQEALPVAGVSSSEVEIIQPP
jgi:hypothetical protein